MIRPRLRPSRITTALLAAMLALPAAAQVTLKMATLVPENSSWFRVLREMGDSWNRSSGGRVKLVLYPGGRQGDDPDVVRKMHVGSLNGALLTAPGLATIDRSIYAMNIPMAFDSYEERDAVMERMRPRLEAAMEAKGFVVLNWADGGWVHFFSKKPVATPDDLRRLKFFQWAGDPQGLEIWKAAGFNPVSAPATELATGLQTGLLEAFSSSPQIVLITRYYEQTHYMADLKWAVIPVGTVVTREAWAKVPADAKPAILQAAREAGEKLKADLRASAGRDLQALQQAGLKITPVDAAAREQWHKVVERASGKLRGEFTTVEAYDEVMHHLAEVRRAKQSVAGSKK
jgi:TRAP-type C4-dicarboxylate transport system substrate-binding protein